MYQVVRHIVLTIFALLSSMPLYAKDTAVSPSVQTAILGTAFEQRQIKDSSGRLITYYINHPDRPAPLLLMIQGSGCVPIIHTQDNNTYSTLFNLLTYGQERQFTVMAVEKPFAGATSNNSPGTAVSCSEAFNNDFTAESWLIALQTSLSDARKLPWVDTKRTLVFGLSEGAVMAALLAGHDSRITDVVAIGGSGTTQLFDFVAAAYRQCFDVSPCLDNINTQLRAIQAAPSSTTQFAWGHPYKRWTSFLRIDPAEELLHSKARVYLAFGTNDESTPALSQEITVSKLSVAERDVTVRRVANANHSLINPDNPDFADMDKEFRMALNWFWTR